jgi:hypothetical protein
MARLFGGKRIYPDKDGDWSFMPGDYGFDEKHGFWMAETPNGLLGSLANHEVTEYADGTITVSPSILVRGYSYDEKRDISWHGFLERGVWREI